MAHPCPIAVGVAGWSYPDWEGYVYAGGVGDRLRFLSRYVDMVEVNSSFYAVPTARHSARWLEVTLDRPEFFFTAKLPRDITHEGRWDEKTAAAIAEGFRPLLEAGKLHHFLAQFRYDFRDETVSRTLIARLAERLTPLTSLTLELRHASWQAPEALAYLNGLGVGVAQLDYPASGEAFTLDVTGVGRHAYFRLHGRNARAWFDRKAGRDETYNYLYSADELKDLRERANRIASVSATLTIVANNHYQGKEVVNALQLKSMLTGYAVSCPPALALRYPQLRDLPPSPPAAAPA